MRLRPQGAGEAAKPAHVRQGFHLRQGDGGQTADKQALKPAPTSKSVPPLPSVGFAPVRPMDVVRATYDFAAQHPEILEYVPCYCGCGSQGHSANESCFVARRDAKGNVLEWDTHGFGFTICVDVAREAMQLYRPAPTSCRFAPPSRNAGRLATPPAAPPRRSLPRRRLEGRLVFVSPALSAGLRGD